MTLNGPVLKWLPGIGDQVIPVGRGDSRCKEIGIKRWPAYQRQNFARPRI